MLHQMLLLLSLRDNDKIVTGTPHLCNEMKSKQQGAIVDKYFSDAWCTTDGACCPFSIVDTLIFFSPTYLLVALSEE